MWQPVIGGLVVLLCSNLTRLDPQFSDQSSADLNFLQDPCEHYEFSSDQDCGSVKERLRRALDFWREMKLMRHSLFWRDDRPLLQISTSFSARNNSFALEHSPFVENAISALIRQGCGTDVFEKPIIIINSLFVSIHKSGKKRLILGLRNVNQFLFKQKLRCEDLSVARQVLCPADYISQLL